MSKKKLPEDLRLLLFGDNAPGVDVTLDEDAPKLEQSSAEKMDAGDTNCACE